MSGVRDKVTDLIFRARVVGAAESRSAYRETAAVHESTDAYGVGEPMASEAGGGDGQTTSGGGEDGQQAVAVKQIVRDTPKVGRNDLCPCGSGKKYNKCHGANAA